MKKFYSEQELKEMAKEIEESNKEILTMTEWEAREEDDFWTRYYAERE